MTRRELAVILAVGILSAVILVVQALWPSPAASDVPAASGVVPAGEFEAIGTRLVPGVAQSVERRLKPEVAGAEPASGARASHQPRTPSPTPRPAPAASETAQPSVATVSQSLSVSGVASWFTSPIGVSAAGPALRAAIGAGWRGTRVTVCGPAGCALTVLGDWCACPRRAIDLDAPVFAALAPLSQGLMEVTIEW